MSKHTPAPWTVAKASGNAKASFAINCANGFLVADVIAASSMPDDRAETVANAALIAAAPELLEAAQYVIAMLAKDFPNSNIALDKCRAAIAKAGGAA